MLKNHMNLDYFPFFQFFNEYIFQFIVLYEKLINKLLKKEKDTFALCMYTKHETFQIHQITRHYCSVIERIINFVVLVHIHHISINTNNYIYVHNMKWCNRIECGVSSITAYSYNVQQYHRARVCCLVSITKLGVHACNHRVRKCLCKAEDDEAAVATVLNKHGVRYIQHTKLH